MCFGIPNINREVKCNTHPLGTIISDCSYCWEPNILYIGQ